MHLLKYVGCLLMPFGLAGCQLGYYLHSAYHQTRLIRAREPIDKILRGSRLTEEQRRKLRLVQDVKTFAESNLGLARSSNYTSYIQLDEPYVTYIVQAAFPYELKAYHWHFPFVGDVPYKGYFRRALAEEEAAELGRREFDTYVRGVSAFSTLGWFEDSVLSSMLRYEDVDLVETIIHETVHTTLFVKGGTEFNERLATFLGHEGMRLYYEDREGHGSKHLEQAKAETVDQRAFSTFITREIKDLRAWYEHQQKPDAAAKANRLLEIKTRFVQDVKPLLKTRGYHEFETRPINNALLLAYGTYEESLDDFETLFASFDHDYARTLEWLMTLKHESRPEAKLKEYVLSHAAHH